MSFSEKGYGASGTAGHVQSHHRRPEGDSVLCATEDCAEFSLGAARQSILHIQDQVSEFF